MTARILDSGPESLALAAAHLATGGLVGMPTETVYGLAADAFAELAVAQVFAVKERPSFDPLIVHVATSDLGELAAQGLIGELTPAQDSLARRLVAAHWPGPLTLVLPRGARLSDLVTSGLPTVGIRRPGHAVAEALIRQSGRFLAAPSANRFGRISPTSALDVFAELGERIAYIVDGGPASVGVESTVARVEDLDGSLSLLRPGGIDRQTLSSFAPTRVGGAGPRPASPGQLESHYAPQKPLHLLPGAAAASLDFIRTHAPDGPVGVLVFAGAPEPLRALLETALHRPVEVLSLSEDGDLTSAAQQLFRQLRRLDASSAATLFAERCPTLTGLGHAITDRLSRAAR